MVIAKGSGHTACVKRNKAGKRARNGQNQAQDKKYHEALGPELFWVVHGIPPERAEAAAGMVIAVEKRRTQPDAEVHP